MNRLQTNITNEDVLVLIDIQNDFLPGGPLGVTGGDEVIPVIEDLAERFDNIVATQDWHPAGHKSFASSHGAAPFSMTRMPYGDQVLWPDHCVQGTEGAELRLPPWVLNKTQLIIRKGFRPEIDSYSALFENDGTTPTGLAGWMQDRGIKRAFFVGLATDYCVGFSALDSRKMGFESVVLLDGCRGIAPETIEQRIEEMKAAGVVLADSLADEMRLTS